MSNLNQALEQAVNEMDHDFVESVVNAPDSAALIQMKKRAVEPDERELIQARIDFLYRQAYEG